MDAAEFQETVQTMIQTIDDPVRLAHDLRALVETRFPVLVFHAGEKIPMFEFARRFKKGVCAGVEPTFWQWPVRVTIADDGELMIALGIAADGKIG